MQTDLFLQQFVQHLALADAKTTRHPNGRTGQPAADFCLSLLEGTASVSFLDLTGRVHIDIGRHRENSVVVNDPTCSRHHCRLTCDDGVWFLEDLLSRNGTFVNGSKIHGEYLLCNGDELQIGNTKFQFREVEGPVSRGEGQKMVERPGSRV